MHRAYLGQHQFSIEGVDVTVAMLDEMIGLRRRRRREEVVIGMAHRGRLNVLAHNLGRRYELIFAEFEGASTLDAVTTISRRAARVTSSTTTARRAQSTSIGRPGARQPRIQPLASRIRLAGRDGRHARRADDARGPALRARHTRRADHDPRRRRLPRSGRGRRDAQPADARRLPVGGTLHLITNNQTGFTTDPDDARSTHWASDLAKGFDIPIIHVNADDVEACISAVRLAFAYRERWGHDVLIDLIGYRRFGHNESDEPAYTQPEMYSVIAARSASGSCGPTS